VSFDRDKKQRTSHCLSHTETESCGTNNRPKHLHCSGLFRHKQDTGNRSVAFWHRKLICVNTERYSVSFCVLCVRQTSLTQTLDTGCLSDTRKDTTHDTRHTTHDTRHTTHDTRHTTQVVFQKQERTRLTTHDTWHTTHDTRHTTHDTRHKERH